MWENYFAADNYPTNTNNLQQQMLPEIQKKFELHGHIINSNNEWTGK